MECVKCHKVTATAIRAQFGDANRPTMLFCSDECLVKVIERHGLLAPTVWDVNEDGTASIRPFKELCCVARINGEGHALPCKKERGHGGDHDYETVHNERSNTYCPATKKVCDRPCVGSVCLMLEKPLPEAINDALTEAAKDLPCGNVSPIGPTLVCDLPLGHDDYHENKKAMSSWPKDYKFPVNKPEPFAAKVMRERTSDPIRPYYYHGTTVDDFIAEFKLGFRLGSAVKYIARHEHKDKIQDLKKALWYLTREIEKLEES